MIRKVNRIDDIKNREEAEIRFNCVAELSMKSLKKKTVDDISKVLKRT